MVGVVVLLARHAGAVDEASYRHPSGQVTGVSGAALGFAAGRWDERAGGWKFEVGEHDVFSIPGLALTHARVGYLDRRWGALISSVWLSAPVGSVQQAELELIVRDGSRWMGTVATAIQILRLRGLENASVVGGSLGGACRVSANVIVGYRADRVRLTGVGPEGVRTGAYGVFAGPGGFGASVHAAVERDGTVDVIVGSTLRIRREVGVAIGYRDRTGSFRGALDLRVRRIRLMSGVSHHPVLGLSKSVFLAWGAPW